MEYLAAFGIGCIGCGVNMVCGFGFGILAMMVMPFLMDSAMGAAAFVNIVTLFQASWILFRYHGSVRWSLMAVPLASYFVVSFLVVRYASGLANDTLKIMLGVFLIVLSIYFVFFAKRVRMKPGVPNGVLAGALGGVMSALFSVGGPPVSLYFSAATEEKEAYLATIQTYFLFSNIYIVALRAVHGIITKNVLLCSAFAVVGMALGTYLGSTVLRRISADAMRKTIYGMMAACGLAMILF